MYESMSEAINAYDEYLNEIYPNQVMDIDASRILREVDPIAYRVGFHEYVDAEGIDSDDLKDDAELP